MTKREQERERLEERLERAYESLSDAQQRIEWIRSEIEQFEFEQSHEVESGI